MGEVFKNLLGTHGSRKRDPLDLAIDFAALPRVLRPRELAAAWVALVSLRERLRVAEKYADDCHQESDAVRGAMRANVERTGLVTDEVECLRAETTRLRARCAYYESVVCYAQPRPFALPSGEVTGNVEPELVAVVIADRDYLRNVLTATLREVDSARAMFDAIEPATRGSGCEGYVFIPRTLQEDYSEARSDAEKASDLGSGRERSVPASAPTPETEHSPGAPHAAR